MYARYEVGLNSLTCSDGQRIQRARRCQPTWRTFRQWKTAARVHTQEDRGALAQRRASVRHQSAAARLARLREQDTWQVRDCSVVKHKKLLKRRHQHHLFMHAFSGTTHVSLPALLVWLLRLSAGAWEIEEMSLLYNA